MPWGPFSCCRYQTSSRGSASTARPYRAELIDHARPGDRLCIIRLDRLGRSLRELLETVDNLKARGIHLLSLEERLDTSSAAGELVFHVDRHSTRTQFPPRRNSSRLGLSPARTAKQLGRATAYRESQKRSGDVETEGLRSLAWIMHEEPILGETQEPPCGTNVVPTTF